MVIELNLLRMIFETRSKRNPTFIFGLDWKKIDLLSLELDNIENLLRHCSTNNFHRFGQWYLQTEPRHRYGQSSGSSIGHHFHGWKHGQNQKAWCSHQLTSNQPYTLTSDTSMTFVGSGRTDQMPLRVSIMVAADTSKAFDLYLCFLYLFMYIANGAWPQVTSEVRI